MHNSMSSWKQHLLTLGAVYTVLHMLAAHFSSLHLHPAHVSEHNNYYKNNYVYMYMLSIHISYGHTVHYSTHLMNSIQELQKDWAKVMFQNCSVCLVTSFGECVPKGKPALLHHHTKSLQSVVVRVRQQLHQGNYLGSVGWCQASVCTS